MCNCSNETLSNVVQYFSGFAENLGSFFTTCTPNFDSLSDIATFEGVIIALAIPLSFEIVSRISERYESEVISKKFVQEWEMRWLPFFLVFNIVFAITLRFFKDEDINIWGKVFSWTMLTTFIISGIILLKFLGKLKKYMTDTEFIIEGFFKDAEQLFKE